MGEKLVPLTRGMFAKVDEEDYEIATLAKFHAVPNKGTIWYAAASYTIDGKVKGIWMHRLIMPPPEGYCIDHINGDGLDNRRCNLRVCTFEQNMMNRRKYRGTLHEYKGIAWCRTRTSRKKWVSRIRVSGRLKTLGHFSTKEEAAREYDKAALKYFGEFANLNFKEN